MAIARCLTESEVSPLFLLRLLRVELTIRKQYDLEHRLSIFIREEVVTWSQMSKNEPRTSLRELVLANVDAVVRRAKVVGCSMSLSQPPSASIPANQAILELLLQATSAQNLSRMDPAWVAAL